jgi:hypothetical protein
MRNCDSSGLGRSANTQWTQRRQERCWTGEEYYIVHKLATAMRDLCAEYAESVECEGAVLARAQDVSICFLGAKTARKRSDGTK